MPRNLSYHDYGTIVKNSAIATFELLEAQEFLFPSRPLPKAYIPRATVNDEFAILRLLEPQNFEVDMSVYEAYEQMQEADEEYYYDYCRICGGRCLLS
jgi:hypothetical protein